MNDSKKEGSSIAEAIDVVNYSKNLRGNDLSAIPNGKVMLNYYRA